MREKVLVGLSGGVDSAVTAYLLKEQGYDVTCVTLDFHGSIDPDAERIASSLSLPFRIIDVKEPFQTIVESYFTNEYLNGRTPNPCIICNPFVKFKTLLDVAKKEGFPKIATGHYASVVSCANGRFSIKKADFLAKDQTYALYRLTQDELSALLLPLGAYKKEEVREIARSIGFLVADKTDSEEICFIPDNDHPKFIKEAVEKHLFPDLSFNATVLDVGKFVTSSGDVLGKHQGIISYTIGQRKGLGIAAGHPIYVTKIDPVHNEIVLGENEELFSTQLICDSLSFMGLSEDEFSVGSALSCTAKIRYGHKGTNCIVKRLSESSCEVLFQEPVRAITPGQSAVFYENDILLLGGIIQ